MNGILPFLFCAYEKLLLLPPPRRGPTGSVSRCRPTTAPRASSTEARRCMRPRLADGRDTLDSDVGVGGAPRRSQLVAAPVSWCPMHPTPSIVVVLVVAHAERYVHIAYKHRRSRSHPLSLSLSLSCARKSVRADEICGRRVWRARLCVRAQAGELAPRTFVLIKGTSKLKVMICRNISVLALLPRARARCPTREMESLPSPNASSVSRTKSCLLLWGMLTTLHLYQTKGCSVLTELTTANRVPRQPEDDEASVKDQRSRGRKGTGGGINA